MADGGGADGAARQRVILAIETSCDDTCAAVVTADGEVRSNVIASPGAAARALRRRRAGDRLAAPPGAGRTRWRPTRWSARAPGSTTSTRVAVTRGPGLIGALLVGLSCGEGARGGPAAAADAGRPSARPRGGEHARRRPDRAAVPLPRRERRPHLPRPRRRPRAATRSSARRSTTPPARPSTRARGCSASAIPAARRSTGSRARAIPTAFDVPALGARRARLQLQRPQDVAALHACATSARTRERAADLAASYQRAIVEALTRARPSRARARPAWSGWRSAAAWRPTRELRAAVAGLGAAGVGPAGRALHRQRRDDRRRRALPRAAALPGLSGPRRERPVSAA